MSYNFNNQGQHEYRKAEPLTIYNGNKPPRALIIDGGENRLTDRFISMISNNAPCGRYDHASALEQLLK